MLANMADLREQIAVASHDLEAIERILETLGCEGELPTKATRVPAWCCSTVARSAEAASRQRSCFTAIGADTIRMN